MTTFKITVVFGQLKLIIPCNPEDCVRDLVEKCVIRYKKATKKPSLHQVAIAHLKTQKDGAILDDDDLLRDVLDDREQVIAVYEEWASYLDSNTIANNNTNNLAFISGVPTSHLDTSAASSNGSEGGDAGQVIQNCQTIPPSREIISPRNEFAGSSENLEKEQLNVGVFVSEADCVNLTKSGGLIVRRGSDTHLKIEAAVLVPLPNGSTSPNGDASPLPPGLVTNEANFSNHRRWSLTAPPSPHLPTEKEGTKTVIALKPQKHEKQPSISPVPQLLQPSFQRDGPARRSAVTDAERWMQSQSEKQLNQNGMAPRRSQSSSSTNSSSISSRSASRSASPLANVKVSAITGEQYETVHLKQEAGALGIHVIPRVLQHSKMHMGLYLQAVEPQGRVGRAGLLTPGDCIIAVNGVSLLEMPFASAQDTFRSELQRQTDYLELDVVRKNYAALLTETNEQQQQVTTSGDHLHNNQVVAVVDDKTKTHISTNQMQNLSHVPSPEITQPKLASGGGLKSSALTASGRKIRKRVEISLVKGSEGLGFTLASRDNETNPNDRQVVVKHIQAKGVAATDGRLRIGDRILEINGRTISDLTQPQAVAMLKAVAEGSKVHIVISRLVDVNEDENAAAADVREATSTSPSKSYQQQTEHSSAHSADPLAVPPSSLRQYLTYDIQLNDTGSAGLGVSLKASSKTTAQNLTHDLGIFIMKIIHGGAAHKDGRLVPNDQLVEVNGVSLLGKTNADAMDTLKQAILVPGPRQGFIRIRVARACRDSATVEEISTSAPAPVSASTDNGLPHNGSVDEEGRGVSGSITDAETGGEVFMREAPLRQSMSEKRHNLYQDPRGTEAYRRLIESRQLQQTHPVPSAFVARPKSVEPEARIVSPDMRRSSPPPYQKPVEYALGGQPHPSVQPVSQNLAPRRSTSLESVTAAVTQYQQSLQQNSALLAQSVVLPPPSQRVINSNAAQPLPPPSQLSAGPASPPLPVGSSPFTRKSSLNQSFRSAVDRSAPAQINEAFEDPHAKSPERKVLPQYPALISTATPPYPSISRPNTAAPSSAPQVAPITNSGGNSSGLKGLFRLGKSKDNPADTNHRQRFYDIERVKQQKILIDQQQQQPPPQPAPSSSQRPSATSLHSLPASIQLNSVSQPTTLTYNHSPEYQRIPQPTNLMSPPRHPYQQTTGGIRQPPSYIQHQQMIQQQQNYQHNLLQPASRTALTMSRGQAPLQPASVALTQHIPPPMALPSRQHNQQEVIYARPQIIRPQPLTAGYSQLQPTMGTSSARYPLVEPVNFSYGHGVQNQYRSLGASSGYATSQQIGMMGGPAGYGSSGIVRPINYPPAQNGFQPISTATLGQATQLQQQQQQLSATGYHAQPSPTARV